MPMMEVSSTSFVTTVTTKGSLVSATAFLACVLTGSGCMANQPKAPVDDNARLDFCRSVLEAIKPGDKLCGPYLSRLRDEVETRKKSDSMGKEQRDFYRALDIQGKCKKYIGQLMGRGTGGMVSRITSNDYTSATVAYMRNDNTFWMYECKTDGNTIVWRAIPTDGPEKGQAGRWREEDRAPINSL